MCLMQHNGRDVSYAEIECSAGHDSFLLDGAPSRCSGCHRIGSKHHPNFWSFDFDVIARWIVPGERVLDLGCGDGLLPEFSRREGIRGYGVDNDPHNVLASIRNGVNVLQFDLEKGLAGVDHDAFDHVIMSLSLRPCAIPCRWYRRCCASATRRWCHFRTSVIAATARRSPRAACRFPKRCPISGSTRRTYVSSPLPDFEAPRADNGIVVHEGLFFDEGRAVTEDPNLNADVALYRLDAASQAPLRRLPGAGNRPRRNR